MTLALIGTVVSYLEKNQEKLKDVTITGLSDVVRWMDRLLGAFTIASTSHRFLMLPLK